MTTRLPGNRFLLLLLALAGFSTIAKAQSYCAPASTVNTSYFFDFHFKWPANNYVTNPDTFANGPSNYTNNSATSAGTIPRFFNTEVHHAVYNPTNNTYANSNVRMFVDWNQDGDFNDAYEAQYSATFNLTGYTSYNAHGRITVPLNTPAGNYRLRYAFAQGGAASACGAFTGETEDFKITVGAGNTAPVLASGSVPFMNNLLSTQTDNEGISLDFFLKENGTGNDFVTDADDRSSSLKVPRGIAITSQSASNGAWQYKIGGGSWTAFGAVSTTNALLISGSGLTQDDATAPVRIRFLPSGPGTPSFTYRAWDMTSGTVGGYANATTTGGTTAFSTTQQSVNMSVLSPQSASLQGVYTICSDTFMRSNGYDGGAGILVHPQKLVANSPQHVGNDIRINSTGSLLYWTNGRRLYSAHPDGTVLTPVVTSFDELYSLSISPNYLFYSGYDTATYATVLYRSNLDGTSPFGLLDGAGQIARADLGYVDKMYYNNGRLYAWMYSTSYLPYFVSIAPDGTAADTVYTPATTASPYGLHIVNDTAYWLETDGSTTRALRIALGASATPETLATTGIYLNTLVADPANHRLLATSNNRMYSVDITNGTITRVLDLDGYPSAMTAQIASTSTPLSVQLASWNAAADGKRARLQWEVGSESRGTRYEIQRSADGSHFVPLVQRAGNGSPRYAAYDETPLPGNNYYRLAINEPDGSVTQSAVRTVSFAAEGNAAVFPNPMGADGFTIRLSATASLPQGYTIVNAAGRVVSSGTLTAPVTRVSSAGLAPGSYILRLQGQAVMLEKK